MSRPTTNSQSLRRILQQELALGNRLLALMSAETDVIVINDLTRLGALQAEQQRCLKEQSGLEKKRVMAARDLAWGLGLERVPTLIELIHKLPVREQEGLGQLRAALLAAHRQIEVVQTRNRRLIANALEYVRFSLELLTEAALQPARYGTNLTRISAPTFYIDSRA